MLARQNHHHAPTTTTITAIIITTIISIINIIIIITSINISICDMCPRELNRRYGSSGITSFALHPGVIPTGTPPFFPLSCCSDTSLVTRHTSHVTRHTSHVTRLPLRSRPLQHHRECLLQNWRIVHEEHPSRRRNPGACCTFELFDYGGIFWPRGNCFAAGRALHHALPRTIYVSSCCAHHHRHVSQVYCALRADSKDCMAWFMDCATSSNFTQDRFVMWCGCGGGDGEGGGVWQRR